MTPPIWHQKVFELARLRLSELPPSQHSTARLLFIKYGEIHCRTFFDDSRDADTPGPVHYQIWKRIDDLKDTPAEAYAVALLANWSDQSGHQTLVIDLRGAERNDPHEIHWVQRVSFDPAADQITGHECWTVYVPPIANALSPC